MAPGTESFPLYDLPSIGMRITPTRSDAEGQKRVDFVAEHKPYGVLEYGIKWHVSRFSGAVRELVDAVGSDPNDMSFPRSSSPEKADELLGKVCEQYEHDVKFARLWRQPRVDPRPDWTLGAFGGTAVVAAQGCA